MLNKIIILLLFEILFSVKANAQEASSEVKFGGPFTSISYNKHGASLSVGGGGTFIEKNNFFIGIFGQGTTSAYKRTILKDTETLLLESKQTGVWLGYKHRFSAKPKWSFSVYNKIGFGKAILDNPEKSLNYYDSIIVYTPNIELGYKVFSFLEIGLATYYEAFTKIDFYTYTNADFNSYGTSLLFKFKGN